MGEEGAFEGCKEYPLRRRKRMTIFAITAQWINKLPLSLVIAVLIVIVGGVNEGCGAPTPKPLFDSKCRQGMLTQFYLITNIIINII